ncbi:unnamed protein product [Eruca vesicaria subsp. sativa]|uniref:Uncharacterized protein n=1 Tax=Eruca vesicaria subsp. sativa TaxID=29727 RepID=A0ABC8KIM4_ERUVS|nr:unnamed protein product [Eruca vesicaria subsp. sativa]
MPWPATKSGGPSEECNFIKPQCINVKCKTAPPPVNTSSKASVLSTHTTSVKAVPSPHLSPSPPLAGMLYNLPSPDSSLASTSDQDVVSRCRGSPRDV